MNLITRTVFTWCWLILAVFVGIRADQALTHVGKAHLTAEPSLCRRAGVSPQPGGCVMDAKLGWRFPGGEMLVSPLDVGTPPRTVTVTPIEQRSLAYAYQPQSYYTTGGITGTVALYLICAAVGLYPSIRRMRLFYPFKPRV